MAAPPVAAVAASAAKAAAARQPVRRVQGHDDFASRQGKALEGLLVLLVVVELGPSSSPSPSVAVVSYAPSCRPAVQSRGHVEAPCSPPAAAGLPRNEMRVLSLLPRLLWRRGEAQEGGKQRVFSFSSSSAAAAAARKRRRELERVVESTASSFKLQLNRR